MILAGIYADSKVESRLILTNFSFTAALGRGELQEDEYGSLKHTEMLMRANRNLGNRLLVSHYPLKSLTTQASLEVILGTVSEHDQSQEVAKIFKERMGTGNVCFMDMRGEKELSHEDGFEFLVFGGILGDHPPQDRAIDLRSTFDHVRHLGSIQMTTDTAVLVAREIVEEGKSLASLKFVTDPSIPCDELVKRYLDLSLPLSTLTGEIVIGSNLATLRTKEVLEQELQAFETYNKLEGLKYSN